MIEKEKVDEALDLLLKDKVNLTEVIKEGGLLKQLTKAILALESFEQKWNSKYPQIAKSWYSNWPNLIVFLHYPEAIRKIIYTTNILESLNSQLRKVTNNKRVFPSDEAVFKSLFLTIQYIVRKWTVPIQNWNEAMAHFMIKFEGRI